MNQPKILLFIASARPTNYDRQIAASVAVPVVYRNALTIKTTDSAEACDGVMGSYIPAQYKDKPDVAGAMTTYRNALKAEAAKDIAAAAKVPTPCAATIAAATALVSSWRNK